MLHFQLAQKNEMLILKSKQAVMGEMISMIAHQWRQPLSMVTLQISNLEFDKMFGRVMDEDKVWNTFRQVSDTMVYLSETVDDFQTYFLTDKETQKIEVHELLGKVLKLVSPRAKVKQINFEIHKEKDIYLQTYRNELMQVLLNIVNNGIDAFEGLQREEKHIFLHVKEHENMIEIFIEDNGCGILEENLHKLFSPNFSTKGKNGTGLGLYMSQQIMQNHLHGKINIQSSPKGSSVIVSVGNL